MPTSIQSALVSPSVLLTLAVVCACSGSPSDMDGFGGGTATGGSTNPGSGGGSSTTTSATGGSTSATGGSTQGGNSSGGAATGGKATGGATTGGAATGGAATGGKATGGAATGGTATGGKATGGAATGGAATGGKATGGAATGGAATGGTATGGAATGGAATGGSGTGGTSGSCTATGFYTKDGKLYDAKCNEFIMRGVNYPYAWFTTSTQSRFADIASTKSNAVRVVLSVSRWGATSTSTVSSIISWAKANKLIAVLEVHDCTGYGDEAAALNPDSCVAYWLKSDMIAALKGNEAYVIINIANEAFGNSSSGQWASFYTANVPKFRTAGLRHTLMVDAPHWAQDWQNVMRDGTGATTIFNADPDRNVVFAVHMYDVYGSASAVTSYFSKFLAKKLPLVVGEFAADHGSAGNVDEATIMAQSQQYGVGYLGWSWSGNSSNLSTLDITNNFNVSSLSTWGNTLINGTNGIKATAKPCTVF